MNRSIIALFLAIILGCVSQPQSVNAQDKSQEAILAQLKVDLAETHVVIEGRRIDLVVHWITHADARRRSRRLNVSLADNKLGAFIAPIQNLTLNGPSLKDVRIEFAKQVEAYLQEHGIPESRVQVGEDITNYMNEDAE